MICEKCKLKPIGNFPPVSYFNHHHIIPKCIGGTDKDGRIYLCEKCHNILHLELQKQIFKFVPENLKVSCRKSIKAYTAWYIKREEKSGDTK